MQVISATRFSRSERVRIAISITPIGSEITRSRSIGDRIDRLALDCDRVSCRMLNIIPVKRGAVLSPPPYWKGIRFSGLRVAALLAVDFLNL